MFAVQTATAVKLMKPVPLPPAGGRVVGTAFSPDSNYLALVRNVPALGASGQRHILQIVELRSGKEVALADVLQSEPADLATSIHFIEYSPNGRYLLLTAKGSEELSIIEATTLKTVKRIALYSKPDSRASLRPGHRYFRGVVGLSRSAEGDFFGALTHNELESNKVFVGSFSSGRIIQSWSVGEGRTSTELGSTALSLSEDGSKTAVTVLPDGNSPPKGFNNLRLYNSSNGQVVKSIRTHGLIGHIMLLPDENILASRIDTPGLFAKKTCLEEWNVIDGSLVTQFCDQGRSVIVDLATSVAAGRVVGFAAKVHKSIEGQVYAASGRVDVWDKKMGNIVAVSDEIPHLVSHLKMSANGKWVVADQTLYELSTGR